MKTFLVTASMTFTCTQEIEAETEQEAIEIMRGNSTEGIEIQEDFSDWDVKIENDVSGQ